METKKANKLWQELDEAWKNSNFEIMRDEMFQRFGEVCLDKIDALIDDVRDKNFDSQGNLFVNAYELRDKLNQLRHNQEH